MCFHIEPYITRLVLLSGAFSKGKGKNPVCNLALQYSTLKYQNHKLCGDFRPLLDLGENKSRAREALIIGNKLEVFEDLR